MAAFRGRLGLPCNLSDTGTAAIDRHYDFTTPDYQRTLPLVPVGPGAKPSSDNFSPGTVPVDLGLVPLLVPSSPVDAQADSKNAIIKVSRQDNALALAMDVEPIQAHLQCNQPCSDLS